MMLTKRFFIALLIIVSLANIAGANLLNFSSFESNWENNYVGPLTSEPFPMAVSSSVWASEVVGQWVPANVYAGWKASDGDGGIAVNLRKASNGYIQAVGSSALAPNMPLELSFRTRFLSGANDSAVIHLRVIAANKASSGQTATNVKPNDASSAAVIMASADISNWQELGFINVPALGADRDVWTSHSTDLIYPGGWDYIFVAFSYSGAANANYYQLDDVELNEPEIFAYAGEDFNVIDTDDSGSETVTLDGSGSVSLLGTITSYSWTEDSSEIATGANPSVDLTVGIHDVTLTVTDSNSATATDDITVEVIYGGPRPPVADCGAELIRATDFDGDGSEIVALDGSASTDPDSTIISWVWTEDGSTIATGENTGAILSVGIHEITLTVTDDTALTSTDTVTVNVRSLPDYDGNEISQHKSGISIGLDGVNGLDYLVENWYHDVTVDPRCTIYIRSDVSIEFFHNAMNLIVDDIVGENGGGIIRYRTDMDLNEGFAFDQGDGTPYSQWSDGASFDTLQYFPGQNVLGATGAVPGVSITDKSNFYWRGILDSTGDQWHTISVWDDDYDPEMYYDGWCSDGKIFYFVVNPVTPCISFKKVSSGAQWYTNPIKAYFVPQLRQQISYLTGEVEIELAAIDDQDVEYSLRSEFEDSDVWQPYTGPINTVNSGLASDTRYELRYRIGSNGPIKTRVIHYDPAYPSDAEQHPQDILWKGQAGLDAIADRIYDTDPARAIYSNGYNSLLTNDWLHRRNTAVFNDGFRKKAPGKSIIINAFPMILDGIAACPDQSEYVHDAMLDNILNLDPLGLEGSHARALPCKELCYQGYYSVQTPLYMALAYDWLISDFRADTYANGFTAIEDYKMRDMMAAFSLHTLWRYATDYSGFISPEGYDQGMWSHAWLIGTNIISAVMPEYNSPLYGSSGAPKGNSGPPELWTPYPDHSITWWDVCTDRDAETYSYPNMTQKSGYWGLMNEVPQWYDRKGYFAKHLMGYMFYINSNFRANYDNYHFNHYDIAYSMAADGDLEALKYDEGNIHQASALLVNHNFPTLAPKLEGYLNSSYGFDEESISSSVGYHNVLGLILYEDDWADKIDVLPGDADRNGAVNIFDFLILKSNFGRSEHGVWGIGDFDANGTVDIFDFLILKANFGQSN